MSTMSGNSKLTPEQQRVRKLEARVAELEEQMLGCLQWMRYQAEKKANRANPDYPIHEIPEA